MRMYEHHQGMALRHTHPKQDEDALATRRRGLWILWLAEQMQDEEKQFSQALRDGTRFNAELGFSEQ